MGDWDSKQYLKFKNERTQPAADLANRISIDNPKRILDLGCGPGNSTRVLKKRFPDAYVLGVDSSPNMIQRAKAEQTDIEFMLFDAENDFDKLEGKFDIVFSNACIQWIPDHSRLLRDMMSVVNEGGLVAVQIPYQYEQPVHKIITDVVNSDKWKPYFPFERAMTILHEEEYYDLLNEISSDFYMWKTVYFHRMPSYMSIIEWYRSTGLKPYLELLAETAKAEFETDVLDFLPKYFSKQKNGEIILRFPRLFFVAYK